MNDFLEFLYEHIPHRWLNKKAKGTKRLFEGLAKSIEYCNCFVEMLQRNNQTREVQELITELENEYGIVVNSSYDLDFRRERIIAKIRMQDSPVTAQKLIEVLESMGFFDVEVEPLLGEFQINIKMKSPEQCRYKLYEVLQILHENIRAHIGFGVEMTTETPMPEKKIYVDGAVFRPIAETILPELEYEYHFDKKLNIGGMFQSITETTLPEMPFEINANINIITDYCNIEVTTLSELKR